MGLKEYGVEWMWSNTVGNWGPGLRSHSSIAFSLGILKSI